MTPIATFVPQLVDTQKPRKGARWTDAEIALALRLRRDEQRAVAEIARILGRTTATVYTKLRILGAVLQEHRVWTDAEISTALEKLAEGATYAAAAATIGRTENELRAKIAYDRIAVAARRSVAACAKTDKSSDFSAALRAEIEKEERPLKAIASEFGVSVSALSKLAREIHGRRYRSAASRDAARAAIARGRAAKAAKADKAILWTAVAIARLKAIFEAANGAPDLAVVARTFGSTPRMVDTIARRYGLRALKRARRGLTEAVKRRAQELARDGVSITPAARELCVDVRTLRAFADSVGLDFAAPSRAALAMRAASAPRQPRGAGLRVSRKRSVTTVLADEARLVSVAQRAELRAQARALVVEARRCAMLARKDEREKARAQAKAERELAKKLSAAQVQEAKRRAMFATGHVARRRKPVAPAPSDLAALVAAHIAQNGVTRAALSDVELAVAAIRRRGYGVTHDGDAYRIDQMTVPAAELFAFAEKRGINWKERSAA